MLGKSWTEQISVLRENLYILVQLVHIYFIFDFSNGKEIQPPVMLTNVSFDNLDRDRLLVEDKDANVIDSPVTTTTIASTTSSSGDLSTTGL